LNKSRTHKKKNLIKLIENNENEEWENLITAAIFDNHGNV
jgi:hypothetical protein